MATKRPLICAIIFCTTFSAAQQSRDRKLPDASGTVTGHVFFDDAKAPARKATVYLQPVASLQVDASSERSSGHSNGPVTTVVVGTQFDGSYSFTHVAPGSYYVIASCPGYISPLVALTDRGSFPE